MTYPHHNCTFRLACFWTLCLGFLACAIAAHAAPKIDWAPVSAEELSNLKPQVEPEAPAEIVLWNIEVDDRNYPQDRKTTEYIRYKIFSPEKVDQITRISDIDEADSDNMFDLHARLISPSGQIREFGKESIKERNVVKHGSDGSLLGWLGSSDEQKLKERFLAISGVEPGAVLEYKITRRINEPDVFDAFQAQKEGIPVRQLEYKIRISPRTDLVTHHAFIFNNQGAKMTEDSKAKTVTFTAQNLPSVVVEPMVGPVTDYTLTILSCYESCTLYLQPRTGRVDVPDHVEAKAGPWAYVATLFDWLERDRGYQTGRVKKLASDLTAGVPDETEKARRIHRFVQMLVQNHAKGRDKATSKSKEPDSLDDVLDWEKLPEKAFSPAEFHWLAIALYRAAGLDAHTVLLPNREFTRFNPDLVSRVFLSDFAAAVRIKNQWQFAAAQNATPLPFGQLPWQHEGAAGLLALAQQQAFIPIPCTRPDQSVIASYGVLTLDAEGTLTGDCRRTFTGQTAATLRRLLRQADTPHQQAIARSKFGLDPRVVEVTLDNITGLDDPDETLKLEGKLRWPGFAVPTKNWLIVRPAVFRADATSPFTATSRHQPVHFRFPWEEIDWLMIQLPPGWEPEALSPPPANPGNALHHRLQYSFDKAQRMFQIRREFAVNVIDIPVPNYAQLKAWYDQVISDDRHELVFRRPAPPLNPAPTGPGH